MAYCGRGRLSGWSNVDVLQSNAPPLPSLADLGTDLLWVGRGRRVVTILIPFACVAAYIALASWRLWPLAVVTLMYLSFATYGSISHDLVHRTLGLSRRWNEA